MIDVEDNIQEEEWYEHHKIKVDAGQSLVRIDKYLMDRLPNVSRNKLQIGIHEGAVRVNEKSVKPNYRVRPQDIITVVLPDPPRSHEIIPENIPLDVIFEDDHIIIINKPPGMVVHPAHQNWSGTLVNALAFYFSKLPQLPGNDGRPGLVHRIDKGTSGLLVVGKNDHALSYLARQFFDHTIERTYYALVWGEIVPADGTINNYLGRSPKDRRLSITYTDPTKGRYAVTHYKTLEKFGYTSLVQCNLETGRTHQIRAHMKSIGHPLFNDSMYGGSEIVKGPAFSKYRQFVENCFDLIPRQALHAKSLGFKHPYTKEWVQFETELPSDFTQAINKWRNYSKAVHIAEE